MQTVDDIKPCFPLFRNDDYKQTISNKRAKFEDMHDKEKIEETFKWTTSQEYQELNFKREALTINPAKACQPLGSSLCGLGFHKTLVYVHGSQGCIAYFRTYFNRHFKEPIAIIADSMTEDAAVFGGQKNVHEGLANASKLYDAEMIAMSTTCIAEVIGDDLNAFIGNARKEGHVPQDFPIPFAHTPSFVGSHITGWDNMEEGILRYFTLNTMDGKVVGSNGKINIVPGFETYRLGGVVDAAGTHVADDLEKWVEAELAARGDDLGALCDDYADSGLTATRLTGRTHYLVASTGPAAADFIQIEIEELQEMACHALFDADNPPGSIEELVDPRNDADACASRAAPLGSPFLALRRLTPVADTLARIRAQKPEPQPIHRFIEAWEASSAGAATQFSNHWVLGIREHLDRYRQTIFHATPIAAVNGAPPRFDGAFGVQGLSLHNALARYDKAAGYPMAWFFNMITTRSVPHALSAAVMEDTQAGFHYLPDRDADVVKDWLYRPYGF